MIPSGEEPSHPEHPQDPGEIPQWNTMHDHDLCVICASIRIDVLPQAIHATDLTLGLRRIPADFHVIATTDDAKWQTSNTPVYVGQAVVEWNECILLPASKVRVSAYASFKLGPILSHRERLRTFEISIGRSLDRSEISCRQQRLLQITPDSF
ncbi:hypothetical protein EDB19DRAFT_704070 [Suillus lakei]|nr:hypothetical protein EDB19DRAFT_704070 [Suillus lakei]